MAAAEVNGSSATGKEEEEPMDVTTTHSEDYQTLIDAGLPQKVAESLDNIFQTGGWWLNWLELSWNVLSSIKSIGKKLSNLFFVIAGLVAYVDLDERAIDALREFNEEGALTVLQQFKESDLSHVQVTTLTHKCIHKPLNWRCKSRLFSNVFVFSL